MGVVIIITSGDGINTSFSTEGSAISRLATELY